MRKEIQLLITAALLLFVGEAFAQQGFGTNLPDKSAAVDIVSSKRGLLIPRVALTSTASSSPITAPARSLMVYNTTPAGGTGDVSPGFYYWEGTPTLGKWVRFVASDSEKTVTVSQGENITVTKDDTTIPNTTDYKVAIKGSQVIGQVLVTKTGGGTEWIDPSVFIAGVVTADNGLTMDAAHNIQLGGALKKPTKIETNGANTLAITNLEDISSSFVPTDNDFVIMDANGVLKRINLNASRVAYDPTISGLTATNVKTALDALAGTITTNKGNLVLDGGLEFTGTTNGTDKLLADAQIQIANQGVSTAKIADGAVINVKVGANAITSDKILDGEVKTADLADLNVTAAKLVADGADVGKVATVNADGTVSYLNVSSANVDGKNLTAVDGSIVVTDGAGATLVDANVKVADGGITTIKLADLAVTTDKIAVSAVSTNQIDNSAVMNIKIADRTVSADKMTSFTTGNGTGDAAAAGTVPVADGSGNVTYQNVSTTLGKTLTTDGKIVIGANNVSSLANAVLVATELKIAEGSITSTEIANNTIMPVDINSAGNNLVLITGNTGTVQWVDQSTINDGITANNGLTKTDKNIQLGGALLAPTEITTAGANTLAVAGLVAPGASDEAQIVMAGNGGVLRNVARSLTHTTLVTMTVDATTIIGYNGFVPEITVLATIGTGDLDITLPAAGIAKGQVINVKITNTTEPDGYVNIKSAQLIDGLASIYGGLAVQGWIIKSNGATWSVVGRN